MGLLTALNALLSCWRNPDLLEPRLYDDKELGDSKTSLRSPGGFSPIRTAYEGQQHVHKASAHLNVSQHKRPGLGSGSPRRPAYPEFVDKPLPPVPSVFEQTVMGLHSLKQVARIFRTRRRGRNVAQPSSPTHRPDQGIRRVRSDAQRSHTNAPRYRPKHAGHSPVQVSHPTHHRASGLGRRSERGLPPSNPPRLGTVDRSRSRESPSAYKPKFSNFSAQSVNVIRAGGHVIMNAPAPADQRGWQKVVEHSAPSAIHTSRALADLGRCDVGTRHQVFRRIEQWIRRDKSRRVLCMTGAAGSGKSAIALTAAESFTKEGLLAASFFFSSSDSTRATSASLVFTIANQLGLLDYRLRDAIDEAMNRDPNLVEASLDTQARRLILEPFLTTQVPVPPIILIDGADECQDEKDQDRLISFITDKPLWDNTPFRFLITARPEVAIREAQKPGGCLNGSSYISLSDDPEFDATEDIKQSLHIRLQKFAGSGTLDLKEAIDTIANASSGQYIYPATVIQYVSVGSRRGSALGRIQSVVKWIRTSSRPESNPSNPLHALDELYRKILSGAAEYVSTNPGNPPIPGPLDKADEVDPFFLVLQAFASLQIPTAPPAGSEPELIHDGLLGLRGGSFNSVVCDLRSLVRVREPTEAGPIIQFYHRTCSEFLQDKRRAGKGMYVPSLHVVGYLAKRLCGVFLSSAESAITEINSNQGLFAGDEKTWLNCTSAYLLGDILKQRPNDVEASLKRFREKEGLEKIRSVAILASKHPRFAEDAVVKAALANWASCLRAVQNSRDKEFATYARNVLAIVTEAESRQRG